MPSFSEILSAERFHTYLTWSNDDPDLARRLYTYNVQLSAALYGPLHMLEVALRNTTDKALTAAYGLNWMDVAAVLRSPYQTGCVSKARATLLREKKAATHPQMVAELNFGFWSSLFGRDSHHLWSTLRPIFQARGIQPPALRTMLRDQRLLRNRVAHYEPILSAPLAQRYAEITTLTGWLSPSAAGWIATYSTWPAVYPAVPILVPDTSGALRVASSALPYLPPA